MENKPQKRHQALQPLSREHHHGLLLCWKIRTGFSKGIAPDRIKTYADWFFKNHLIPHFEIEEKYVFSLLEDGHELKEKALEDHKNIIELFSKQDDVTHTLHEIETTVNDHIRFEERVLFPEIQKVATEAQFAEIEAIHQDHDFVDNLADEFWK
ncbi:hemerythrin domain-containing protein [Tamlana sp. 2_MG-2023]|uniref:hemerythrin domain-containing protein n=1 Tax=unclassified Tamlana TaxID=2614803 RepID=UPI0026E3E12A|nr:MULTISPECIES: hemerythrin domain-containing protein [unclassified Tamlana]MDO6759926.1 hemerythrin domain-containing protein [Tamlana sp. 2_MG-2023]MDO6791904.1 hemerythrin domain-containing protein [Tamlana sp. 1_MG-2023]